MVMRLEMASCHGGLGEIVEGETQAPCLWTLMRWLALVLEGQLALGCAGRQSAPLLGLEACGGVEMTNQS